MEITNEIRARIFADYWGSPCRTTLSNTFVNEVILKRVQQHTKGDIKTETTLILTDLSDITDEHIDELWLFIDKNSDFGDADSRKRYFLHYFNMRSKTANGPYALFDFLEIEKTITFLRSKSYHIPYMGIDLFEAGIAVKATQNKK